MSRVSSRCHEFVFVQTRKYIACGLHTWIDSSDRPVWRDWWIDLCINLSWVWVRIISNLDRFRFSIGSSMNHIIVYGALKTCDCNSHLDKTSSFIRNRQSKFPNLTSIATLLRLDEQVWLWTWTASGAVLPAVGPAGLGLFRRCRRLRRRGVVGAIGFAYDFTLDPTWGRRVLVSRTVRCAVSAAVDPTWLSV